MDKNGYIDSAFSHARDCATQLRACRGMPGSPPTSRDGEIGAFFFFFFTENTGPRAQVPREKQRLALHDLEARAVPTRRQGMRAAVDGRAPRRDLVVPGGETLSSREDTRCCC